MHSNSGIGGTITTGIIIVLLAAQLLFDIFLIIESRRCVREAEHEVTTARDMKNDTLTYRDEVARIHKVIMEVINGEEASTEDRSSNVGSAASGADTDPYFKPISG